MTLSPGTRLGPYEILAQLGAGGMGEVYRAKDFKLKRDVAIKVLPQSLATDPDALARFEREALAVAALSHPNILAIFDFAVQDGVSYAVTELLEGETLRRKLNASPIPEKQAVDYALQLARGLSAAHEKGIVHRDLKPENLLVSKDGHLKILDFGLAKRTEQEETGSGTSSPTASMVTEVGIVMGTLGYMSPEQVKGFSVDHRSDLFSFGAVLYEMLSGKRAFKRDTAAETMSAILTEEPPELSESGRSISPALDQVVKHCMEKDRSNRFQSAKDIAFALSQASGASGVSGARSEAFGPRRAGVFIAAAAVLVAIAAGGVFLVQRPRIFPAGASGPKRIAVLPFENLGAPEDEYFADGVADEIRGKLTSLPGVEVIARASSTSYKKTTKTSNQIAQELDVRYLLTATVRWQKGTGANRVHVSPELVEVKESGAPASKWQQPFDAALSDVFQVQSDIATKVAQALGVALGTGEEKRLLEKPTLNLGAWDAFLKGEEAWDSMDNDWSSESKLFGYYDQAVALDPGFAQAWARVAFANSYLYSQSPRSEFAERTRQAAEKAAALAPDHPDSYLAAGVYAFHVLRDQTRAMEQFSKAQRVAPGNALVLWLTAGYEAGLGRWDAAVEHFSLAERLDPRSVNVKSRFGHTLTRLRRYPEARETFDRGLALVPENLSCINGKVTALLGEGDLAGARAVVKAESKKIEPTVLIAGMANSGLAFVLDEAQLDLLLRLTPSAFRNDRADWGLTLAGAYALKGDAANVRTYAEEARKDIEERLRAAPEQKPLRVYLGVALAYLGRKDEAIREGERGVAHEEGWPSDAWLDPDSQRELARIYMLVGEPEKALDHLEPLLKVPSLLSPGRLRVDPAFDPLRKNPRFQKLVVGK